MNFLKKLFDWDADSTIVTKILTVVGALFFLSLFFWLFGSAWGLFNNEISQAARTGGSGVMGTIFLVAAVLFAWAQWTDKMPFHVNDTLAPILLFILLVLSMLFYTGFYAHVY